MTSPEPQAAQSIGGATIFSTVPSTRLDNRTNSKPQQLESLAHTPRSTGKPISKSDKDLLNERQVKQNNINTNITLTKEGDQLTSNRLEPSDVNSNTIEGGDENMPPVDNTPSGDVINGNEESPSGQVTSLTKAVPSPFEGITYDKSILRKKDPDQGSNTPSQLPPLRSTIAHTPMEQTGRIYVCLSAKSFQRP